MGHIIFMCYKCILNYALNTECSRVCCSGVMFYVMLDISIFVTRRGGGGGGGGDRLSPNVISDDPGDRGSYPRLIF